MPVVAQGDSRNEGQAWRGRNSANCAAIIAMTSYLFQIHSFAHCEANKYYPNLLLPCQEAVRYRRAAVCSPASTLDESVIIQQIHDIYFILQKTHNLLIS